jgi:nicotinate-nucleotide adenylyltransferase
MLRLAVEDNTAFVLEDLELMQPGPSYTADTLVLLREKYTGDELFFILGQDALSDLPNWHHPARIAELATLAVAARDGHGQEAVALPAGVKGQLVHLMMPLVEISGSDIRSRVGAGRSIRYRVPPAVEEYIRGRGLYRD